MNLFSYLIQRVQWIHLVIIVFTRGPMFLSSTALYHETNYISQIFCGSTCMWSKMLLKGYIYFHFKSWGQNLKVNCMCQKNLYLISLFLSFIFFVLYTMYMKSSLSVLTESVTLVYLLPAKLISVNRLLSLPNTMDWSWK